MITPHFTSLIKWANRYNIIKENKKQGGRGGICFSPCIGRFLRFFNEHNYLSPNF
jgi:hypothetical protein